jgi:hypothetical protein
MFLIKHHTMNVYVWKSEGITPRISKLNSRWTYMLRPLYSEVQLWYPLNRRLRGLQSLSTCVGIDGKIIPQLHDCYLTKK